MKTAHQFAKELLDGPDLPIIHPEIKGYSEEEESGAHEPVLGNCTIMTDSGLTEARYISYNQKA